MNKVVITGALGRMGSNNVRCIVRHKDEFQVVGATENPESPNIGRDIGGLLGVGHLGVELVDGLEKVSAEADVIIDFSFPLPTLQNIAVAARRGTAMVIGTTGFSAAQLSAIRQASDKIPIVLSSNMSVGINLLLKLVYEAASVLGSNYDVEIVEMHHRYKKDSPSGTALSLGKKAAQALNIDFDKNTIFGRNGVTGERGNEIAIHSLRGGDVVGEHTVIFSTIGERIEFTHKAGSRDTFSQGAFRAAKWIVSRKPGIYSMNDVLGFGE